MADRIDPRAVYLAGSVVGTIGGFAFARFVDGIWSACLFQALKGIALAGTHMPGLRILTQRLPRRVGLRLVPYYTATFGVGTSLSFLWSGWRAAHAGWWAAFVTGAVGAIAGALLMALATTRISLHPDLAPAVQKRHPLDFSPVLRNRDKLAYVVASRGHC
jgi:MFS family permease